MPIAEARIDTDRPSRYLTQFCKHAAAIGSGRGHQLRMHGDTTPGDVSVRADWSDTVGTVAFNPWGQCRLQAGDASLVVRVEAANMEGLQRIEQIVTNDLDRFSHQQLAIAWHVLDAEPAESHRITTTGPRMVLRRRRIPWLVAVAAVAIVAAHLAAGGFVLTRWGWPLAAAVAIAAVGMLAVGGYHVARGQRWRHGARHEPRD